MPQHRIEGRKVGRTGAFSRALCGAALAALFVCAGVAAARAGDDDDTMSSHTSFYDEMLQVIGLGGGDNINYSERSPLVVPPTRDLPPPQADVAPSVPDWPKDPDLMRQSKAKAKKKPKPQPDYVVESSRPLRPGELNVPGIFTGNTGSRPADADPEAQPLNPAVTQPNQKSLFSFGLFNSNKTEYATFTGEPARASLTDPPPGYLTPSPDQPYGIGPDHRQYKVPTVADRMTESSGSEQSGN
ncbi:MAG TPA: hypothetical protein VMF12_07460 [Xanthobacteraceae bacterium]|nr:hypothetical protein [Xanthobacteraceae bacterium]